MEGISEEEKPVLIGKLLMPVATLDAIAQEYGITRQRVCAIFKASIGRSYSDVKQDLISEKFKCIVCGSSIPMSKISGSKKKKNYCSEDCRKVIASIDISQLSQCKYNKCKTYFFQRRNWKFIGKKEFCCLKHYLAYTNEGGQNANNIE